MATPSSTPSCQSCGRRDAPHEIVLPGGEVIMTTGCLCTAPDRAHDHWESIGCAPLPRVKGDAFRKINEPALQMAQHIEQRRRLAASLSEAALEGGLAEAVSNLSAGEMWLIRDLLPPEMLPPTNEGEDVG